MIVDLHTHTNRYSKGCSALNPKELVSLAHESGLDGVAITEHNYRWSREELEELKTDAHVSNLCLFRGIELEREGYHLLVFNYDEEVPIWPPLATIVEDIHRCGGVVILAHPFRRGPYGYNRLFGLKTPELKKAFDWLDGIEVLTPSHTPEALEKAWEVCRSLNVAPIGSSDSHTPHDIGRYATRFPDRIVSERDLAEAIRRGDCHPVDRIDGFHDKK